jgi:hypothetical protein
MRLRDSLSDAVSSQLGFISPDALFNNHWLPSDHVLPIICPSKPRCNIFKDQGSPGERVARCKTPWATGQTFYNLADRS